MDSFCQTPGTEVANCRTSGAEPVKVRPIGRPALVLMVQELIVSLTNLPEPTANDTTTPRWKLDAGSSSSHQAPGSTRPEYFG